MFKEDSLFSKKTRIQLKTQFKKGINPQNVTRQM